MVCASERDSKHRQRCRPCMYCVCVLSDDKRPLTREDGAWDTVVMSVQCVGTACVCVVGCVESFYVCMLSICVCVVCVCVQMQQSCVLRGYDAVVVFLRRPLQNERVNQLSTVISLFSPLAY